MKAMVFAAGQGLRLRPLTDRLPKALVPVAGRPMIEYPLLLLRHYGIREIIINLHHLGEQIEAYLGDGKRFGVEIIYSREPELLDTGGGLLKAQSFLDKETFIVLNTDIIIDVSLTDVIAFHKSKTSTATLVLRPDPDADRFGSMDIGPDGRIYRFLSARSPSQPSLPDRKLMFTGVQILEPRVFDYMPGAAGPRKFGTTKDTYPHMLTEGEPLYGYCFDGLWQDLGTPQRIQQVEQHLLQRQAKLHYLAL